MTSTRDKVREEALAAIGTRRRSGIVVTMSGGKTLIALTHMANNYNESLTVLVVGPKRSVFKTWKDEMEKFNLLYLLPHITFVTYRSMNKLNPDDYDIIYLDEDHNLIPESHNEWLSRFPAAKIILGLTGTKPKYKGSGKGMMVERYCPMVYEYLTDEAVDDKIINDYRIVVHLLPLDKRKNVLAKSKNAQWYTSEFDTYSYWSRRVEDAISPREKKITRIMRMKAMQGFPSKEVLGKKLFDDAIDKCILFANTKDQAARLSTYSYYSGNTSSEQNLEAFKKGEIMKLSCVLQLNEGVNIPKLKESIILHAYGNEHKTSQRLGRTLRLNPDETATIHILCYQDTVDVLWTQEALSNFDQNKIRWVTAA